ncbi:MAG: ABC transporter ATP-binding protein/permease [Lactobacillus iners]|uniref:ATP-binding cassette domain-containing protein n=1 Tax=Lactobacillus iners TaxID=147802 RepID=UPI0001E992DB|nr:ABC transporter ATP-binding protein [Lactobacillus iners]EFQ51775.1 ABC transporter, ATP-binding protein [Lactobacillus iners LEAF 3008A-a]MCT7741410.1 ABC transporter ATP-binding protein/permease [Lactobacillus iners]MCT7791396.1 ABC transporter ATP-binding protein/permease [Lactobacillus iners]MCT7829532.1 ABC transporter ATP-binding protein/permease [Lactobacillus iners]MCT7884867.1 ABC transporter ATP-binding protein/permease [Lactobacillus iners]
MSFQKLIKTNLLLFIVIIVLELLFAAGSATSSYIIQFAYNQLVKNILIGFLIIIASSVFLSFVSYIFSSLATYLFSKQTQKYIHSIRHNLISKYFHDKAPKVAEMENELNSNLQVLTKNYADKSLSIIQSCFLLVTSIGSLLLMNWMLTLLALILSVITLYIPRFTRQRASNATQKVVNRNSKYLLDIEEWFNGLEELRKYTAFNKLNLVMQEVSKNLETSFVKRKKVISIADFLNGCANSFSQIAITLLAAILFFNHQVTFGVIIAAGNFSSMILNCLLTITTSLTRIQSVQGLNKQIVEFQKVIPSHKEINTDEIYSISTHDLSISFKNGETIHFPDIRIKKGEKVLLSGDSGTGKSTLFKLILNKMYPTTGQVIFEDKYGKKISPNYAQIGYIPQDGKLFPTSIINNIIMFNNKLKQQVKNSVENNDLSKDIASMPNGFETKIDLDTINFSGGQKQKIILARNEIHNFSIILADEATSAIDSKSSYRILKNLVSSNKTVIVIAHNLTPDMEKLFSRKISL